MKNAKMREKVQTKLNSMANILLDDIIVPDQEFQQGQETISASYYDQFGNKFSFDLTLSVTPFEEQASTEPVLSMSDQIEMILAKITHIEQDVANLQAFHTNEGSDNEEPWIYSMWGLLVVFKPFKFPYFTGKRAMFNVWILC